MIPAIAFIVWPYVATRMIQILCDDRQNTLVKVCAFFTILISLFSIISVIRLSHG
jgi:hypothetical protein